MKFLVNLPPNFCNVTIVMEMVRFMWNATTVTAMAISSVESVKVMA